MKILKSFFISFSIYSKIPMPQFEWKDEDMQYTLCFFPWVGAVIGGLVYAWVRLSVYCKVSVLTSILIAAAIPLLVTGGFHVDGFMDTMDALHSYQSKERKLEILKDAHIGAFAVIMLLLYYMIYIAAYAQIQTREAFEVFCMGFYLSRILSGIGVVTFPSAKKDGMLYCFASTAHEIGVKCALYAQLFLCACGMIMIDIKVAGIVIATAFLILIYYRQKCIKEFGGITGDTAGFFVTICEGGMCIAAAVASLLL